jgi:hypothetical protein
LVGGFQAWLGSGAVFGFLLSTQQSLNHPASFDYPYAFLKLINPYYFINYPDLSNFHWFALPLGNIWVIMIGFSVFLHFLGSYFIWQSLQRCFSDRNATMLSKQQSYLLTIAFTIITIGSANWDRVLSSTNPNYSSPIENIGYSIFLNFFLFLYLIAALTPHRHTLQDWARYRHMAYQQGSKRTLIQDLIWGEKSPGVVAIAINAIIAITGLSLLSLISLSSIDDKFSTLIALIFAGSLAIIYAALTQLLLLMKNGQRLFWTNGILGGVIILPVFTLAILFSYPEKHALLWLLSVAAPLIALHPPSGLSLITVLLAIMGHAGILGLFLFQMTRQLKKLGESATKQLLAAN